MVTFKQGDGQSNTQRKLKSINNNNNTQSQLNTKLNEKDHTHCNYHEDLFAAVGRERPPDVMPAP